MIERLLGEDCTKKRAIQLLDLRLGDSVLDVACNEGQNSPQLREAVGPSGTVIGIDPAQKCVEKARVRARSRGWVNVHYEIGDVRSFNAGHAYDGILMGYCVRVIPDVERVIEHLLRQLRRGGRLAICDAEIPQIMSHQAYWRGTTWLARTVFGAADHRMDLQSIMEAFAQRGLIRGIETIRGFINIVSVWEKL